MKKKIIILGMVIAVFLSMATIIINQMNELNQKQKIIDSMFRASHAKIITAFNTEFHEMALEEKDELYNYALSGIDNAIVLYELTSYQENEHLFNTLVSLKQYMNNNSPLYNDVDHNTNIDIFDATNKLFDNLESKESAIELEELLYKLTKY